MGVAGILGFSRSTQKPGKRHFLWFARERRGVADHGGSFGSGGSGLECKARASGDGRSLAVEVRRMHRAVSCAVLDLATGSPHANSAKNIVEGRGFPSC